MNKLLLIALAVLVPFVALVAWGLSGESAPPRVELPEPAPLPPPAQVMEVPPQPIAPPVAVVAAAPPAVVAPPELPKPAEPYVVPSMPPQPPPEVRERAPQDALHEAAAEQVRPALERCYQEHHGSTRQVRLRVLFSVSESGAVTTNRLKVSDPNPYLSACIEDSLASAKLDTSRGIPRGTVRGAYDFGTDTKRK